jgi:hypothetical protein
MSALEQYWAGVTSQLQVEADVFNRLIHHNGEMGRANELSLATVLQKLLPKNLGIGTGITFDASGTESGQCDIIVYNLDRTPQLLAQSTLLLHPVDTVEMIIEVKTTLTQEQCRDVALKVDKIRALEPSSERPAPYTSLFSFDTSALPHTTSRWLREDAATTGLGSACILRPGVLGIRNGPQFDVAAIPLHARDASGARQSETWVNAEGTAPSQLHGDGLYPAESFSENFRGPLYLFEPGRALLLYCLELLQVLHDRGALDAGWWSQYLDDFSSERVPLR